MKCSRCSQRITRSLHSDRYGRPLCNSCASLHALNHEFESEESLFTDQIDSLTID